MAGFTSGSKDQSQIADLLDMELRHIKASELKKLSSIIDKAKAWGKLLEELTRLMPTSLNLSLDAINLIEQQFYCGKSPTLALLNHWAITGRRRPTIRILIGYLHICNLKWAEDYLCQSVLGIESIHQLFPTKSLTERLPPAYEIDNEFKFDNLEEIVNSLETKCLKYSFKSIYETTNGFCHQPYEPTKQAGTKIGEGRFSSVYRAQAQTELSYPNGLQRIVAAKLLKSECNKKYLANEINLIGKVRHENILELLGIALAQSHDGSFNYICLIYEYMQNGSLLDCLSSGLPTKNMDFMSWDRRIDISVKIARGLSYLHAFPEGPIIHRDIKTANIFIDIDLNPKIGDFTLVRRLDGIGTKSINETQFSQNVTGTSVYMPPEAFRGDISIKFDTFSFGIVLLELLTGFKPFNDELDEDLFTYINEKLSDIDDELALALEATDGTSQTLEEKRGKFLSEILDKKAGEWNFNSSMVLFKIALQATESRKKLRPEISSILPLIEAIMPH